MLEPVLERFDSGLSLTAGGTSTEKLDGRVVVTAFEVRAPSLLEIFEATSRGKRKIVKNCLNLQKLFQIKEHKTPTLEYENNVGNKRAIRDLHFKDNKLLKIRKSVTKTYESAA